MSEVKLVSTTDDVVVLSTERAVTFVQVGVQGPAGPSAHGELSGLALDSHLQYHTDARGDARYAPLAHASDTDNPHEVTAEQVGADASGTAAAAVSAHAGGTGVHAVSAVTGLQTALDGKSPTSHDHAGGGGTQITYSSLSGLPTLGTAAALDVGTTANKVVQLDGTGKLPAVDASQLTNFPLVGGITDHGALTGLADDDHTQYHTDSRGDARYSGLAHNHDGTYEVFGSIALHSLATTTVHGISSFGATLVDDSGAAAARTTLGLGGAATLNVGTTTGTVAAGDDARIVASTAAENVTTIGALINGATAKSTPVDADQLGLMDSASSNTLKKLSWSALKTALQSIFATLAGAAGGQTLKGGTAASETLTLQSTAHATKGKLLFGTSAYDEVNNRLGLGQTTPTGVLHLKAGTATAGTGPLKMTSGTLLTVPEAGVVEYLSGTYYLTNSASTPIRRKAATEEYTQARGFGLITNGLGGLLDNTNFSSYTYDQVDTYSAIGAFLVNVNALARFSDEYIPVNTDNRYSMSLFAKSGDIGGGNYSAANKQYIGLALYDADKLNIDQYHVMRYTGSTDTTLAAPLNPGDSTITLTDATGWYNGTTAITRNLLWYGYTNSFGYVYPNYTYTRNASKDYSSNISLGCWSASGISGNVITLRVPWAGPAIASGTAVRNMGTGVGTYKYVLATNVSVPNAWTAYTGYVGGIQSAESDSVNLFRPGTAFVKVAHLCNSHGAADNNVRLAALSLSIVNSANLESQIGIGSTYKSTVQASLPVNGLAVEGDVGLGTITPLAKLHVVKTSEQARFSYDGSNDVRFSVSSVGVLTITTTGSAPALLLTGDMRFDKTVTAGGTTGAQTINKTIGSVNFAAGATSLVVTNSRVSTSSIVQATVATNDSTMKSVTAVAAAGSFTLYAGAAATAETRVNFSVFN